MPERELAKKLRDMYEIGSRRREKTLALQLFGIRYARELRVHSILGIVDISKIGKKHNSTVRQGVKLADYVDLNRTATRVYNL